MKGKKKNGEAPLRHTSSSPAVPSTVSCQGPATQVDPLNHSGAGAGCGLSGINESTSL